MTNFVALSLSRGVISARLPGALRRRPAAADPRLPSSCSGAQVVAGGARPGAAGRGLSWPARTGLGPGGSAQAGPRPPRGAGTLRVARAGSLWRGKNRLTCGFRPPPARRPPALTGRASAPQRPPGHLPRRPRTGCNAASEVPGRGAGVMRGFPWIRRPGRSRKPGSVPHGSALNTCPNVADRPARWPCRPVAGSRRGLVCAGSSEPRALPPGRLALRRRDGRGEKGQGARARAARRALAGFIGCRPARLEVGFK